MEPRTGARTCLGVLMAGLVLTACADQRTPSAETVHTSAPVTSVPDTSAPATSVPDTSAPATSVPDTSAPTGSAEPARVPEGFDTVVVAVTSPDGESCELCLWSADDDERRRRGLMFVDDLGPAEGMAFVYDTPRTTAFTMRNTVLPLTIVFHGVDGRRLDAFDMEPCRAEPCPTYPTPEGFVVAIEIEQGRADELGLVDGSVLEIVRRGGPDDCDTPGSDSTT